MPEIRGCIRPIRRTVSGFKTPDISILMLCLLWVRFQLPCWGPSPSPAFQPTIFIYPPITYSKRSLSSSGMFTIPPISHRLLAKIKSGCSTNIDQHRNQTMRKTSGEKEKNPLAFQNNHDSSSTFLISAVFSLK